MRSRTRFEDEIEDTTNYESFDERQNQYVTEPTVNVQEAFSPSSAAKTQESEIKFGECQSFGVCDECKNAQNHLLNVSCQSFGNCEECNVNFARKLKSSMIEKSCQSFGNCSECAKSAQETKNKSKSHVKIQTESCDSMNVCPGCALNVSKSQVKINSLSCPSTNFCGKCAVLPEKSSVFACNSGNFCDLCSKKSAEKKSKSRINFERFSCNSFNDCNECANANQKLSHRSKSVINFNQSCNSINNCSRCVLNLSKNSKSRIKISDLTCNSTDFSRNRAINSSKIFSKSSNVVCNSIGNCNTCDGGPQRTSANFQKSNQVRIADEQQDKNASRYCDSSNLSDNYGQSCKKLYRLTTYVPPKSDSDDFLPSCESMDFCNDCGKPKENISKATFEHAKDVQRESCESFGGDCSKCQMMAMTSKTHKNCIQTVCLPCEFRLAFEIEFPVKKILRLFQISTMNVRCPATKPKDPRFDFPDLLFHQNAVKVKFLSQLKKNCKILSRENLPFDFHWTILQLSANQ